MTPQPQPLNASLITGLFNPENIAVSGGYIFITNGGGGTVGKYTITGAPVNPGLVTGINVAGGVAVLGEDLFVVSNYQNGHQLASMMPQPAHH